MYHLGVLYFAGSPLISQVWIRQYILRGQQLVFTAQEALWNAPSEYRWIEACNKKYFQVIIREQDNATDGVKPNDLDELGFIILTGLKSQGHVYCEPVACISGGGYCSIDL
jgi:hypothetical protein